MKTPKEVLSFKVSPNAIKDIRRLTYETGFRQYELIEFAIKDLINRHESGKLKEDFSFCRKT